MKRFTETNKWRDPWFRLLSSTTKLLWGYLCDSCDNAGVAETDLEAFSFFIGSKVGAEHLKELGNRIQILPNGKIWIPKFVKFQFGDLSCKNRVHLSVYALLCEHGLEHHFDLGPGNEFPRKRVTDHFRREILGLDQYRCQWCGGSFEDAMLVLDHVIPVIKGGSHSKDNVVACCIPCNSRKKDTDPLEFSKGRNVLDRLSKILDSLYNKLDTPKEKEKDKDKEEDKETDPNNYVNSVNNRSLHVNSTRSRGNGSLEEFNAFWKAYPKKIKEFEAQRAFVDVNAKAVITEILSAIEKQKKWDTWTRDNGQYIPSPDNWLRDGRWRDKQPEPQYRSPL